MKHVSPKRCAVYSRVSSDERLDQSFNSIDAQKEAGHAFIAAQRHEGWIAVSDEYSDGGFSGGNTERPALKRLLADIQAGKIDVVVIYKLDRLTRSLADFARMVELFDQHGVSFTAVSQQINSATSMGRLMLHVLMSFAQFEREISGERIRDKICASKKKGLWMGGYPALGYDVKNRMLVVNTAEAVTVRTIFTRFAELNSTTELTRELNAKGITTKALVNKAGVRRQGQPITKQYLYNALRNPIYIGEVRHRGQVYPGQHEAIIDRALWERVQAILAEDSRERAAGTQMRNKTDALLRGLLYTADGDRMLPTFTAKPGGKTYRYYFPSSDKRYGARSTSVGAIPAKQIEDVVLDQVKSALRNPEAIQAVYDGVRAACIPIEEAGVMVAMNNLSLLWEQLFPQEQHRLVNLLIERVTFSDHGISIDWREIGWQVLVGELAPNSIGKGVLEYEEAA